jgi:DNA-binding NtrC family response regulator
VVLDLVMPDLDGLGVLARMRETGLNTPVIVQTAHGGIDNVVSAMRAGACALIGCAAAMLSEPEAILNTIGQPSNP